MDEEPETRKPRVGRRTARSGFTLAETALAMTVLMVALMSLSAATLRMHSLRRQSRERAVAMNAVRSVADDIQSFARSALESDPNTWSLVVTSALTNNGAIGLDFDIDELTPVATSAGSVGAIQLVTDETMTDKALGVGIGMPRDLDGDGQATSVDVSNTARLLPVVLSVTWTGVSGRQVLRHPFFLMGY